MIFKLNKFKMRHKGEECFIFGDGPSLKYFNLSKFSNLIGISCGMQAFHKDFEKLNVKYYSLIEPYLFYPDWILFPKKLQYIKKHRIVTNEFRGIIKKNDQITFFINLSNLFSIIDKKVCFVHKYLIKNTESTYFKNNNPFQGSFHATLYLAYLMGFSKVYLVGFDAWTRQPMLKLRWYEKGAFKYDPLKEFEIDIVNALKGKMEICNISLDGTACNIDNILYEDFFNEKPHFKENIKIINPNYMSLLSKRFNTVI